MLYGIPNDYNVNNSTSNGLFQNYDSNSSSDTPLFSPSMPSTLDMLNSFFKNSMIFSYNFGFKPNFNTETSLSQIKNIYNPQTGKKLAETAFENAEFHNTRGKCLHGVRTSLELAGISKGEIHGQSAYQVASQLANHNKFQEIFISKSDIGKLPAGCLIVSDRTFLHPHGHITVTMGNGQGASDHPEKKVAYLNGNVRVFIPKKQSANYSNIG